MLSVLLATSCSTSERIIYLQNVESGVEVPRSTDNTIVLMPQDQVSIIVSSRDPELSMLFNSSQANQTVGSDSFTSINASMQRGDVMPYTVDSNGYIDFPVLGLIKVADMTREEVAAFIKKSLVDNDYVRDPLVSVSFVNLAYAMMGEVKTPGRYAISDDQVTLLEALSRAGDLTIYGRRDNVKVTRQQPTGYVTYTVDLRSSDMFKSPAFYVQQGDVIYVEPNEVRSNQSTVNANNVMSATFWLSIASVVANIATLIVYRVY